MRRFLFTLALAVCILAGCSSPPTLPAVTATPTPQPMPTAQVSPTAPSAGTFTPGTPPVAVRLPAPLYVLERGQIARIERDATTRTLITAETPAMPGVPPIAEFTLAPAGPLAYIVNGQEADRLVLTDARGQGARTLYEQAGHELSDLVFTPDNQALLLRLLNNREPPDLPSGLYRLSLTGSNPELLRPDDPVDDPINPARTISGYRPITFSPDGTLVLVAVDSLFYEDCGLGVMPAAGGEVTRFALPAGEQVYCGEQSWSDEGNTALFLAGTREGPGAGPRLWRANPSTGATEPLTAPELFARAPHGMPEGAVRFFLARLQRDAAGTTIGATFTPAELSAPGAAPIELTAPLSDALTTALWAPDGSGVVAEWSSDEVASTLQWIRLDGPPVTIPSTQESTEGLAWGPE